MFAKTKIGVNATVALAAIVVMNVGLVAYSSAKQRQAEQSNRILLREAADRMATALDQSARGKAEVSTATVDSGIPTSQILVGIDVLLAMLLGWLAYRSTRRALQGMQGEAERLATAVVGGELDFRADTKQVHFEFAGVMTGFNRALDAVVEPLHMAAGCFDRIAKGDIPPKISDNYNGDFNTLKNNLNACIDALNAVLARSAHLYEAQKAGFIDALINEEEFSGAYRDLAHRVNEIVRTKVRTILTILDILTSYAEGDFAPVMEKLPGTQVVINEKLDRLRNNLCTVVTDLDKLVQSALEGQLSVRVDASCHAGEFRKIVEGVNRTLDAMVAPMSEARSVLDQLAQRDLCARVKGEYPGDHARIKESVNQTAEALHEALAQVSGAVDQVSAAAGQIASSSQIVADGASQQASSLEETSSALESMSAMSKRTSDNAVQANALAQTAKKAAMSGTGAVEQMSVAMTKIKSSAEGTSQIIRDINEIAFQTNLLALNAAVEAARAGEAGRAFAVVAEEVRSLALRSKEAAMKTEELIKESVRQAGEGEVTSQKMAGKLTEILEGIEKVSGIVNEISASAKEQSAGVDRINRAVADMNKVTQQNAANSEESSSAAVELSSQAEEVAAMVSSFQLARTRGVPTRARVYVPTLAKAARPNGGNGRPVTVKPEAVIPLDGDPAFRDF
jgi:methyl-accepting chemotaxis protein